MTTYYGKACRVPVGDQLFWVGAGALMLVAGLCFGVLLFVRLLSRRAGGGSSELKTSALRHVAGDDSLYGPLLDIASYQQEQPTVDLSPSRWHEAEVEEERGVGEGARALQRRLERRVDWWVSFAAAAEAVYALLFLGVAVAFVFHVTNIRSFSWLVELVLMLFMLVAKCAVAFAAGLIHYNMSRRVRKSAGPWILVSCPTARWIFPWGCEFLKPLLRGLHRTLKKPLLYLGIQTSYDR